MKKNFKKSKGFAMAELLAVCVVVLGLFSVLFSNYLPLLAEYETRLSYNDVTAQYAVHYIRKAYYDSNVFSKLNSSKNMNYSNAMFEGTGYYKIYGEGVENPDYCLSDNLDGQISDAECETIKSAISKVKDNYNVEEIILTKYDLTDLKSKIQQSEKLYKYVEYLPTYHKKNDNNINELYRIIIKTKDFGYATTPILSNNVAKDPCYLAANDSKNGEIYIADFLYKSDGSCGAYENGNITLMIENNDDEEHVMETVDGHTVKGKIVGISNPSDGKCTTSDGKCGAFTPGYNAKGNNSRWDDESGVNLEFVTISNSVKLKEIGDYSFYGTNLINFDISVNKGEHLVDNSGDFLTADASGLKIGKYAFANTQLENVGLSDKIPVKNEDGKETNVEVIYDDYAFSNNKKLSTVYLGKVADENTTTAVGMFAYSGSSSSTGIDVTVDKSAKAISNRMFYQSNVTNLFFQSGSVLTTIGNEAFSQDGSLKPGQLEILQLPDSLRILNEKAFLQLRIDSLTLNDGLETIGGHCFEQCNLTSELKIPNTVSVINSYAFASNSINTLTFNPNSSGNRENITIGNAAFSDNKFVTLELPSDTKSIGDEAFSNCEISGTLVIPEKVEVIGESAFASNKMGKLIVRDGSVSLNIKIGAFQSCSDLRCIRLSNNINILAKKAFLNISPSVTIENHSDITTQNQWCGNPDSSGKFSSAIYYFGVASGQTPFGCSLTTGEEYNTLAVGPNVARIYSNKEVCSNEG